MKSPATATSPRGFPRAAKRITIAGMSWHHIPKDDAWKQAHPAMLVRLGKRAWLHCDDCRHSIMIEPQKSRPPAPARHADASAHERRCAARAAGLGEVLLAGAASRTGVGLTRGRAARPLSLGAWFITPRANLHREAAL